MEGLTDEGDEMAKARLQDDARDGRLMSAAQRAEHREIVVYGSVRIYDSLLGDPQAVSLRDRHCKRKRRRIRSCQS
jgi:ferritin-like metal-binding protein YciE